VISELIADSRSAYGAIALVADLDWPPHAVTMRVLDTDGREVHSEIKATRGGTEFRHSEIGRPSP
jgi:hypothetical protein